MVCDRGFSQSDHLESPSSSPNSRRSLALHASASHCRFIDMSMLRVVSFQQPFLKHDLHQLESNSDALTWDTCEGRREQLQAGSDGPLSQTEYSQNSLKKSSGIYAVR